MKKTKRNLLTVTAIAAALLLTGCGTAETAESVKNLALNAKAAQHAEAQAPVQDEVTPELEVPEETTVQEAKEEAPVPEVKEETTAEKTEKTKTEKTETPKETTENIEKSAPKVASQVSNITLEEAKAKAISHAKVDENSLYDVSAELDDGVYEVEFSSKGTEYNYKLSRQGEILNHYTEVDDDYVKPTQKPKATPKPETKTVTLAEAKKIAYNHAGVNTDNLYDVSAELDDGVYEVEFSSKGTEYNYKISKAGKVISHYTEVDDDYVKPTQKKTNNITKAKAKSIALNHAGVSADSIRSYEIELEGGVYEISFEKGRTEYEYEIKASNGEILRSHKEKDD